MYPCRSGGASLGTRVAKRLSMEARKRVVSPSLEIALVIIAGLASASLGLASAYAVYMAARPF
jgi:hypothetical protein